MATSKSQSLWWNSYISSRNSKWLAEKLQETERLVNEMLKLIEEDGDSFAKKAQMYYQRRPELVARVGDFYHLYRTLAERYDIVISEISKNIPSEFQSQGSVNGSEFGLEAASLSAPSSPHLSLKNKPNQLQPIWKASSFEGLRERSNLCKMGSDESSSESSSECDNGKVIDNYDNFSKLEERIFELEQELCAARAKLHNCKNEHKEKLEDLVNTEHLDLSSTTSSDKNLMDLVKQIQVFRTDLRDREEEIEDLKGAMEAAANRFETEISCRDNSIKLYKTWIDAVFYKFVRDNSSPCAELKNVIFEEKDDDEQTSDHKMSMLDAKLSSLMASNSSYESKIQFFEARVKQLEAEKTEISTESKEQINQLNQSIHDFKMKVDMLTLEKDELSAEVLRLVEDIETWDDESRKIDEQLRELQLEHDKLIQEGEDARKASAELTNQVRELEEEVEMQRGVIVDCAEGKKEAIKHLCFSLEHYREGYQQLRQLLQLKIKGLI
ncbi:protein NETWORKED 4B-like [Phalaenopsis equestris]|uniref:protein NETWORKED 4B-like n=1 Tax=Phalaenopsis equestris TaxID=78828 RepID=UPI0009E5AD6A|nr:protein NETWORKED 4B-like [Phalaenopsis equestris]